ncbi:efflux RND transporter permease subunit [Enterobacter hormaechei]
MQNEMQWRERAERISELSCAATAASGCVEDLVTITPTVGAPFIRQYNQFPSVSVSGSAAEGVSSSTAMAAMGEILAENLQPGTTTPGAACRIRSSRPAIRRYGSCWRRW